MKNSRITCEIQKTDEITWKLLSFVLLLMNRRHWAKSPPSKKSFIASRLSVFILLLNFRGADFSFGKWFLQADDNSTPNWKLSQPAKLFSLWKSEVRQHLEYQDWGLVCSESMSGNVWDDWDLGSVGKWINTHWEMQKNAEKISASH